MSQNDREEFRRLGNELLVRKIFHKKSDLDIRPRKSVKRNFNSYYWLWPWSAWFFDGKVSIYWQCLNTPNHQLKYSVKPVSNPWPYDCSQIPFGSLTPTPDFRSRIKYFKGQGSKLQQFDRSPDTLCPRHTTMVQSQSTWCANVQSQKLCFHKGLTMWKLPTLLRK